MLLVHGWDGSPRQDASTMHGQLGWERPGRYPDDSFRSPDLRRVAVLRRPLRFRRPARCSEECRRTSSGDRRSASAREPVDSSGVKLSIGAGSTSIYAPQNSSQLGSNPLWLAE